MNSPFSELDHLFTEQLITRHLHRILDAFPFSEAALSFCLQGLLRVRRNYLVAGNADVYQLTVSKYFELGGTASALCGTS